MANGAILNQSTPLPTPEEIGAATLYTTLEQIGLSNDDMDATDLASNIYKIVAQMNARSMFIPVSTTNLSASIKAQLSTDLGLTIGDSVVPAMKLTKFGTKSTPSKIEVALDSPSYPYIFTAQFDATTAGSVYLRKFIKSYESAGFLPLDGGTLTGNLNVKTNFPTVYLENTSNNRKVRLYAGGDATGGFNNYTDDDNFVGLYLLDVADAQKWIRLQREIAGATSYYDIYGTHNITSGTEDLTAGVSPLTTNSIYFVYE